MLTSCYLRMIQFQIENQYFHAHFMLPKNDTVPDRKSILPGVENFTQTPENVQNEKQTFSCHVSGKDTWRSG